VLVARGGAKALLVRREAAVWLDALDATALELARAAAAAAGNTGLARSPLPQAEEDEEDEEDAEEAEEGQSREARGAVLRARDQALTLAACGAVAGDVAKWLRVLLDQASPLVSVTRKGHFTLPVHSNDPLPLLAARTHAFGPFMSSPCMRRQHCSAGGGGIGGRLFVAGDHAGTSLVVPAGFVAAAQASEIAFKALGSFVFGGCCAFLSAERF
jgi:hypothetical protein